MKWNIFIFNVESIFMSLEIKYNIILKKGYLIKLYRSINFDALGIININENKMNTIHSGFYGGNN